MKTPPIRFVEGPDGRVAYQVVGDGPMDLVFTPFLSRWNLDMAWELPSLRAFLERLASFSRLILLNPRGTAISDPLRHGPAHVPEDIASDIILVMDEVGSKAAGVFGLEGGSLGSVYLTASYPDRVVALAILNGWPTFLRTADYPLGMPERTAANFLTTMATEWGTGKGLDYMSPEYAKDERLREWWSRLERQSSSAAAIRYSPAAIGSWDLRGVLGSIRAPTLVIEHEHVPWVKHGAGKYIADAIPNATYRARAGRWGGVYWLEDVEGVLEEVQTFFTGSSPEPVLDDRVLATVMFTDIVGSTEVAARVGDQRWRELLDQHDVITRQHIESFRGRPIKSTGDGVLATFDGPARAIRCADALNRAIEDLGLGIRTGLHTGEIELRGEDVTGIAVVIGARVMAEAERGEILVSGSVPPLVAGSGLTFNDRGTRELKGVPGDWRLFAVASA